MTAKYFHSTYIFHFPHSHAVQGQLSQDQIESAPVSTTGHEELLKGEDEIKATHTYGLKVIRHPAGTICLHCQVENNKADILWDR